MIEPQTVPLQALVQGTLACMTERRVTNVVYQSQGLGKILIKTKSLGHIAGNLRYLDRMRQARSKVVRNPAGEHLRLSRQAAKSARLNYAFSIPLEGRVHVTMGCWKNPFEQRIPVGENHGAAAKVIERHIF